jgi:hypothetical protein
VAAAQRFDIASLPSYLVTQWRGRLTCFVADMAIKPTPETIWKRPAYLPYVHAPLTDEAIRKAEKTLGCALPTAFLNVLRVQNGGPIRFRIPESMGDMIAGIGASFPSITDFDLSECQANVDFSLDGLAT